ncbi:unnamed protein product [Mytilus coruscus]|uniref:Reverse transcriptase domain-containing protein n=1 Tax=Mytilus coruscus TaxID=42192 RepID=A0A6J8ALA7_MYTCO|nr:unnamed protein product [Mytilus coruscus]
MTHLGLFRYKRLMFGISCAPEMYNKIIHQALGRLSGVNSIYDDIIVHGKSDKEHDHNLEQLLCRLEETGLPLNIEKCQFNMERIEFMGHILSEHGIGVSESKVQAVKEARKPKTVTEVKSFVGLVNFTWRFIPNLATIAEPLNRLMKKNKPFNWGPEQDDAFEKLKQCLANNTNLAYFDINVDTQVIADASPVGLGAVLVQKQGDSHKIICYASRSLPEIERRYSQTEKEALGLVWACEPFHVYLFGKEFQLLTDHKPLEFIFSPKSKPCARVERWVLRMQTYHYVVKHIPGAKNIADSLSRLLSTNEQKPEYNKTEEYLRMIVDEAIPVAMNIREIEESSENDDEFNEIRTFKSELCALANLIIRGTRIAVPSKLRERILQLAHEGEILQDLNQSKVYSKLDIKWAFHQIELSQDSRDITAFISHQGLFRYKRLMFGISCAPEMYNKIIHQALGRLSGVNSIYDDIIVHGKSDEEHDHNLEQLLCRLEEKGLTLNIEKCQFNMEQNKPFNWGPEQDDAFEKLKQCLANNTNLAYFDINVDTQVIADASPVGLGAVLVQKQGDSHKIICYASRSLPEIERRYSQTEKEALGLVWACERFHVYLFGKEFQLLTDHKPLEFIFSPKSKPCARVERWVLRMQTYHYVVKHIPGAKNIADSLSRLLSTNEQKPEYNKTEEYLCMIVDEAIPVAMNIREIEESSENDDEFNEIRTYLRTG